MCEAIEVRQWNHVRDFSQGVAGRDLLGERIGSYPAKRRLVGRNWYPLDVYKQTLCGELHHFNFYNPWSSGDEADWNNFFIPASPYSYLIQDAEPLRPSGPLAGDAGKRNDAWHDCLVPGQPSLNNCLEAELTPDEHFYENPWFRASTQRSPLSDGDHGRGGAFAPMGRGWLRRPMETAQKFIRRSCIGGASEWTEGPSS